ncbi:MAG: hypothetical protein M1831_001366 [Alyxoria varia]|nr:MAG: hypothetical protein M1831_001366 [Alyxoria varia]
MSAKRPPGSSGYITCLITLFTLASLAWCDTDNDLSNPLERRQTDNRDSAPLSDDEDVLSENSIERVTLGPDDTTFTANGTRWTIVKPDCNHLSCIKPWLDEEVKINEESKTSQLQRRSLFTHSHRRDLAGEFSETAAGEEPKNVTKLQKRALPPLEPRWDWSQDPKDSKWGWLPLTVNWDEDLHGISAEWDFLMRFRTTLRYDLNKMEVNVIEADTRIAWLRELIIIGGIKRWRGRNPDDARIQGDFTRLQRSHRIDSVLGRTLNREERIPEVARRFNEEFRWGDFTRDEAIATRDLTQAHFQRFRDNAATLRNFIGDLDAEYSQQVDLARAYLAMERARDVQDLALEVLQLAVADPGIRFRPNRPGDLVPVTREVNERQTPPREEST